MEKVEHNALMAFLPEGSADARSTKAAFWVNCDESDVYMEHGRMEPVLNLYAGCPVMMTKNDDVAGGRANGAAATAQEAVLKPGQD